MSEAILKHFPESTSTRSCELCHHHDHRQNKETIVASLCRKKSSWTGRGWATEWLERPTCIKHSSTCFKPDFCTSNQYQFNQAAKHKYLCLMLTTSLKDIDCWASRTEECLAYIKHRSQCQRRTCRWLLCPTQPPVGGLLLLIRSRLQPAHSKELCSFI